jgi:hypothetical protein
VLRIELLGDGGVRIEPPSGTGGLASERMARDWLVAATEQRLPVIVHGDIAAPLHAGLLEFVRKQDLDVTIEPTTPQSWPDEMASLQIAANSGLAEQVEDLLRRGVGVTPRRGERSPYRLAMRHGHIATLVALRDAGVDLPVGLRPPAALPNAVVLRNYLPSYVRWVVIACAVVGAGLALALWHWAFLIVAAAGALAVAVGNLVIGRTRLAVDGRLLAVRQLMRWQGPIDVSDLAGIGYAPAVSRRMSGRWRFVQRHAGPPYRRSSRQGFDAATAEPLEAQPELRVVTVYCGRGYLSPGFERHLAPYVLSSPALISSAARQVFDAVRRT